MQYVSIEYKIHTKVFAAVKLLIVEHCAIRDVSHDN